jgi:hypothetical protein
LQRRHIGDNQLGAVDLVENSALIRPDQPVFLSPTSPF